MPERHNRPLKRKPLWRRSLNRLLHFLARVLPGATSVRPFLHRMRGVRIGKDVFIAEEVYLDNEYPEAIEIRDGAQISVRAILIAHTRGPGKILIEEKAYIGPNTVIATSGGRRLRIGRGAVIGASVTITGDVPPGAFVVGAPARTVATARIPLPDAERMEDFIRGLSPVRPRGAGKETEDTPMHG